MLLRYYKHITLHEFSNVKKQSPCNEMQLMSINILYDQE